MSWEDEQADTERKGMKFLGRVFSLICLAGTIGFWLFYWLLESNK